MPNFNPFLKVRDDRNNECQQNSVISLENGAWGIEQVSLALTL
jgi:hypothetical protein